jgi:hypothetical protein
MANVKGYTRRVNGKIVQVRGYKSSTIPTGPGIPNSLKVPNGDADSDAFDAVQSDDDHSFEAFRPPSLKLKPRDLAPPIAAAPGKFPRDRNIPFQFPKVDHKDLLLKGPGNVGGPAKPGADDEGDPEAHPYGDASSSDGAKKRRKRVIPPAK